MRSSTFSFEPIAGAPTRGFGRLRRPALDDGERVASFSPTWCSNTAASAGEPLPIQVAEARRVTRRIISTLSLAAIFIAATLALRHYDNSGLAPASFWATKASWAACADIVIAGDSRVYRGVSPAEISRVLPQCRILNYGFDGVGYDRRYLAGIERVLDPNTVLPTIVLGISPHSLTPQAVIEGNSAAQLHAARRPWPLVWQVSQPFDRVMQFLTPLAAGEFRTPWKRYYQNFHADGWVASSRRPEQPTVGLGAYRGRFVNNRVSSQQVDDLLAGVADWTRRGVRVFGFRPPTCSEMVEVEDRQSGFEEAAFVRRFQAAGGTWLALSQTDYHSYDSSHLRADAAVRFSHDLACRMSEQVPAITEWTKADD